MILNARNSIRKPWSPYEDAELLRLVKDNGATGFWPRISLSMEYRTGKQCRERYLNHLDPDMKKTAWTEEENNVIRDMFPKFGTKWSQYIIALPGRSDHAIKNHYHIISRNNFERCTEVQVILSVKRPPAETSSDESDANTSMEGSPLEENKLRLRALLAARMELDQEILELKRECLRKQPPPPASPSNSEIFAGFTQEPAGELDSEFNFDFESMDADFLMANASAEDEEQLNKVLFKV